MSGRRKLEDRIDKEEQALTDLQSQVEAKKQYISGLKDALKMIPKEGGREVEATPATLRPGTEIAKVRDIIMAAGKPLYITEILEKLGKEPTKPNRVSLSGSIAAYVRDNRIFTRPAPNTFGIVEFIESGENDVTP